MWGRNVPDIGKLHVQGPRASRVRSGKDGVSLVSGGAAGGTPGRPGGWRTDVGETGPRPLAPHRLRVEAQRAGRLEVGARSSCQLSAAASRPCSLPAQPGAGPGPSAHRQDDVGGWRTVWLPGWQPTSSPRQAWPVSG